MHGLLFLFGVTLAAGLFFLLADALRLPRLAAERALLSAVQREKRCLRSLDALFLGWAVKLAPFVPIDAYKRRRMERTLRAAGMDMTAEVYAALCLLKSAAVLLLAALCLGAFPLLSPILSVLAILLYFKESRKAMERAARRQEQVEGALPRFAATVEGRRPGHCSATPANW